MPMVTMVWIVGRN